MSESMKLTMPVHFHAARAGRKEIRLGPVPPAVQSRIPRVTRLMALALKFDRLIREGVVRDYAGLARLGRVSRARVTQIQNLTLLAPDIIEQLLFWPPVRKGRDPLTLAQVQPIALAPEWTKQRKLWSMLTSRIKPPSDDGLGAAA